MFDGHPQFIEFMKTTFHCKQLVHEVTTKFKTQLDLVFSNIQDVKAEVIFCPWSDHYTISVTYDDKACNDRIL